MLDARWFNRAKQPRCNICGRFAKWSDTARQWVLGCVYWDDSMGAHEHE